MVDPGGDWRILDGSTTAWFDASSLLAGVETAVPLGGLDSGWQLEIRSGGVLVRLDPDRAAAAVSSAAADLGLTAEPGTLQQVRLLLDSPDPTAIEPFWRTLLEDDLRPRRGPGPPVELRRSDTAVPAVRDRCHVDVVRPATVVERLGWGDGSGPYGLCHADSDGNEVDLVPGDRLGDGDEIADWQSVFSAVAWYRTTTAEQQLTLARQVAAAADEVGFQLLLTLRPGEVVVSSGKDRWDRDAHGLDLEFTDLAARVQAAARAVGAVADVDRPRFVQLVLDAADVDTLRRFWSRALGYVADRRDGVTDLVDPRRLGPELVFQELDPTDEARRAHRNRLHLELVVPAEAVAGRLDTLVAAGAGVLDESPGRLLLADPEGNEFVLVGGSATEPGPPR